MAPGAGFEPPTMMLTASRSTVGATLEWKSNLRGLLRDTDNTIKYTYLLRLSFFRKTSCIPETITQILFSSGHGDEKSYCQCIGYIHKPNIDLQILGRGFVSHGVVFS